MKKVLLIFLPVVLLLTSCFNDGDSTNNSSTPEAVVYNNFVTIKGFGEIIMDVVDDFIAKHNEGVDITGVTFENVDDSNLNLVVDMTLLYNNGYYTTSEMEYYFRGTLKATITKLNEERTAIAIDVNELTKVSAGFYGTHNYTGSITVNDNVTETTSSVLVRNIYFSGFSLDNGDYALDYSYRLAHEGYNTPNTISDDLYTWSDGDGYGTVKDFANFSVYIERDIVKEGSLRFTSSGTYQFIAVSLDPAVTISSYFTAVYNSNATVTINGIEYSQGI